MCELWIKVLMSRSHTNNIYVHTLSTVGRATEPIGLGTVDKLSQMSAIATKSGTLEKAVLEKSCNTSWHSRPAESAGRDVNTGENQLEILQTVAARQVGSSHFALLCYSQKKTYQSTKSDGAAFEFKW